MKDHHLVLWGGGVAMRMNYNNNRTYRLPNFSCSYEPMSKNKKSKKTYKYLDHARELKKKL